MIESAGFFTELGLFAAKGFLIFAFFVFIILLIAFLATKAQSKHELKIENLKEKYEHYKHLLQFFSLSKEDFKKTRKKEKELLKKQKELPENPRAFVLNFEGDMRANAVNQLRHEVTAILTLALPQDLVVLMVDSPGGVVHGYGLAAAQILRFRDRNIPVTVCVDKIAASGGYLMSVPASKIYAAPFAILGSIGVVAQVPNFNRLLKKYEVDYKEYTAGEFKRTISLFGEVTDKGEKKFVEQLEDTHVLFKSFVHRYRPQLELSQIATGEHWYGEQALKLGLIDGIKTSDEYLLELSHTHQLLKITYEEKKPWTEKLSHLMSTALSAASLKVLGDLESRKYQ